MKFAILTQEDDYPEYFRLDGISYIVNRDCIYDEIEADNRNKARVAFYRKHDIDFGSPIWIRRMYARKCDQCGNEFDWHRPFPDSEPLEQNRCFECYADEHFGEKMESNR